MELKKYLTFDPIQMKEFGLDFFADSFSIRFKKYKRLGLLSGIYIPNGPVTGSKEEIDSFFAYLNSLKVTKVKVDLPLLISKEIQDYFYSNFEKFGYKKGQYIQDNETILISKANEKINNKEVRYYYRKAENTYEFKVITSPNSDEIDRIYEVYKYSAHQQGYTPKSKGVFNAMSSNAIVGVGINKANGLIDGFVWGFPYKLAKDLSCSDYFTIIDTVFIGTNDQARENYVGYGMHRALFDHALNTLGFDFINFEGASRNQNRKYLSFKKSFGGEFHSLGGSYEKTNWF